MMNTNKVFSAVVTLFGFNFTSSRNSSLCAIFSFMFNDFISFSLIIIAYILNNPKKTFTFYSVVDIIQLGFPFIVKNFVTFEALRKRQIQSEIEAFVKKCKHKSVKKNQIYFMVNCLIWVMLQSGKFALFLSDFGFYKGNRRSLYYALAIFLPGVVNAAHEFLFLFYVECLIDDLKDITKNLRKLNEEARNRILENFQIKFQLEKRFSAGIASSITVYFLLLISSLYWIMMRIIYSRLKTTTDFATFFYFLPPAFCIWKLFSVSELYAISYEELTKRIYMLDCNKSSVIMAICKRHFQFQLSGIVELNKSNLLDVSILQFILKPQLKAFSSTDDCRNIKLLYYFCANVHGESFLSSSAENIA